MGSWSHLQVHVSQAHTQPPGQPGRSINLPFNAVLKLACALVFPSLGAPHGSTHPTRVAPYLWGRRSFRPCRRRPQAAVLSQNSHRAGVRAESRGGPEVGKERSPKTEQEANTAFNTFSKSSLSLFSTLALPHESRFPPVLGVLECPLQRNYFFPKVLLLSSKLPLPCTENIVKTHFVKVIRMS